MDDVGAAASGQRQLRGLVEGRGPVCLLGSGRQRRDCGFVRVPQIMVAADEAHDCLSTANL